MTKPSLETVVYFLVGLLCVVVLVLAALSPSFDTNLRVIYQGF
jgi:hypothetical protein